MSGCRRWGEEIGAYLDGELPAEAISSFEAHLSGCEGCEAALEAQRGIDLGLAALPRVEPSPQFEARFWARLARAADEQEPAPAWTWRRWRFSEVALAGAAAAALFWLVSPGDPALSEPDWQIVAETDFELLLDDDHEILWNLEDIEAWDGSEEI